MVAELIVLGSLLGLAYIYVGYPVLVLVVSRWRARPIARADCAPQVTLLIAAHDEEQVLERTLQNKLALDYPADSLELIVVSDGSTDRTDAIAASFAPQGVQLIRQEPRAGKTAALNRGVAAARGEIIVFADANSLYEPDALRRLVAGFADPAVGYVSGKMIYADPAGTVVGDGCSAYMRYENWLRGLETRLGSVVGVDGGIDAVRRALYRPMRADQLPDFVLPLAVVEQGYRVIYEPRAVLREPSLASSRDEYRMRVRVALRALWALHDMRHLLDPGRYGIFAWQLLSHKVLRYGAFLLLALALAGNLWLWNAGPVWRTLLVLQLAAYAAALLAFALERLGSRLRLFYAPYYFTLVNLASGHAFIKYLLGRRQVLWTPRKG